jgi:adenylate cyclase
VFQRWIKHLKPFHVPVWRFLPLAPALLPGTIVAGLAGGLLQVGAWQPLERLSYNLLFQIRQNVLPSRWDQRVAVIAIDEASLKRYGHFPWSRQRYTQLLQALSVSPPAVIGFDILFAEPTPQDAALAQAMATNGTVVLAIGADAQGQSIDLVRSFASVAHQGHVHHRPDADGVTRQNWLKLGGTPALSLAMVQTYNDTFRNRFPTDPSFDGKPVPSLSDLPAQPIWVNWRDRAPAVLTYSFADVVSGKIAPETFRNKLVLVGTTAAGLDPLQTPLDQLPPTSGVYLHAALLDNLLNQRWLYRLPAAIELFLLLVLAPATSLLLWQRQWAGRIMVLGILIGGWFGAAWLLFSLASLWVSIAAPIGTILLAGMGIQLREQHERQLLMTLFAKHVSPETATLLWQHRMEIFQDGELNAQELIATVLFIDVRGFTTTSEKLAPQELLTWLNLYLDAMTDCIMEHGGVVDKYIGDAIMAVFGVPFSHTDRREIQQDATNAIAASLAMHQRLQLLNQHLLAEGKPMIQFGIGIHTGIVVAGSIGGSKRLNYSVLGDTVNVAARLESMNKAVTTDNPFNMLITGETLSYLNDRYWVKPIETLQLRGREQPTMIFSVLGEK